MQLKDHYYGALKDCALALRLLLARFDLNELQPHYAADVDAISREIEIAQRALKRLDEVENG